MPSGLRVNCTALASARYSRCRDTAAWISRPKNAPTRPSTNRPRPSSTRPPRESFRSATSEPPAGRLHQDPADDGQRHDAEDQADQPDVQPHVAVEDVAELVGHHALQLVAGQVVEAALGDGDHGIARGVAGREGVDARLLQNIDGRHRHARGDGHLLDDVEQPLLPRVGGRAGDLLRRPSSGRRPGRRTRAGPP